MKVLVFIVNFQSNDPLKECLVSLQKASSGVGINLNIIVLDNSEYSSNELHVLKQMLAEFENVSIELHISSHNLGYFGGLQLAQRLSYEYESDIVVYSNPDVRFAKDFFENLEKISKSSPGVIAPSIISLKDGFDQNPKYIKRLPESKLRRLKNIYSRRVSFRMYMGMALLAERILGKKSRRESQSGLCIYAAHGAAMVFTDLKFFRSLPSYPCFLFGEELFVAEEAAKRNVPINYRPELRIEDLRSQSISKIPSEKHRQYMRNSIECILSNYYKKT